MVHPDVIKYAVLVNENKQQWSDIENLKKEHRNKMYAVEGRYRDMIRELESNKYKAMKEEETRQAEELKPLEEQAREKRATINHLQKLLESLTKDRPFVSYTIDQLESHAGCRNECTPLQYLQNIYEDEHISLKVCIYQNDRPKNKYTLALTGDSIHEDIHLRSDKGYYGDIYIAGTYQHPSIYAAIQCDSSIKSLIGYCERNVLSRGLNHPLVKEVLDQHAIPEAIFQEAKSKYTFEDLVPIAVAYCANCKKYVTFDDYRRRNEDRKCYQCYQDSVVVNDPIHIPLPQLEIEKELEGRVA